MKRVGVLAGLVLLLVMLAGSASACGPAPAATTATTVTASQTPVVTPTATAKPTPAPTATPPTTSEPTQTPAPTSTSTPTPTPTPGTLSPARDVLGVWTGSGTFLEFDPTDKKLPAIRKITADIVLTITPGSSPNNVFCNIHLKATQKQILVPNILGFNYDLSDWGNIFEASISASRLTSTASYQGDYQFSFTSDLMEGQWNDTVARE